VTLFYYLGVPALTGGVMALLLLILSVWLIRVYDFRGHPEPPQGRRFWNHQVWASGAWTANDSWATNITAVVAVIGSIYGITTAANSIFPGVALDRFAVVIALAGGIVTAAPLLFGVMYSLWMSRHPGATIGASVWLPVNGPGQPGAKSAPPPDGSLMHGPEAAIWTSADAAITLPGGATVNTRPSALESLSSAPDSSDWVGPGQTVEVPLGSHIAILARRLALPGGPDVIVPDESTLVISDGGEENPGSLKRMTVKGGAKITVAGGAEIRLPSDSLIQAPGRRPFVLSQERSFRLPQSADVLVGTLRVVILTAIVTIFGIGAEIGIAAVLAVGLSDASAAGRWSAAVIATIVGITVLCYSVTALRAIADPQPGSSLSSTPGTSFTL